MIKHKLLTLLVALCATTALWAQTAGTTIIVHNLTGWNPLYLYLWGEGGNDLVGYWPGMTAQRVDGNVHYFYVDAGAYDGKNEHLIFNDYNGTQLADHDIILGGTYELWVTVDGVFTNADVDAQFVDATSGLKFQVTSHNLRTVKVVGNDYQDKSYIIPATVKYKDSTFSVTEVGALAFRYCSGLTSITIPNSVTTIGTSAFRYCSGLTSITIPNSVTTIGEETFYECSGLTSVTIGNSVKTIGSRAFEYCYGLTSVTIGNSVTTIGSWAFEGCSGLTSVTCEATTPPTCGSYCFDGVAKYIPLYVPTGSVDAYKAAYQWKDFTDIRPIITDGIVITYTATEKLIETAATDFTKGLHTNAFNVKITSHEFSNGVGTITFDGEVTTIGSKAFYECSGLTSITIPNSVTEIGSSAFYNCSGLTSVSIPNSVTTIGSKAFFECSGLTSVTIGNSVTTIGKWAFYGCDGLTSISIPNSVTSIGTVAFAYCSGLTSVTIGNSVTEIGSSAFSNCSGLTSIDVDAANTHYVSIDGVLFNYAKNTLIQYPIGNSRTKYNIPNSVTTIGNHAFWECRSLTSVSIPNSVTAIGERAFEGCYGLKTVTIPNSVTTIEWGAFFDCSGLTSVTCEATTPPACGYSCFYEVDTSIPLYVPAGSVEAYMAANEWKDFTDIRPITAKEVEVTEIESTPTESAVEIAWPSVVNAETYTIEIRLGDQLICSIVFNAQGQLVSINFNLSPGRGGHTYATTAESTATGWAYTIAGLNPGTEYTYSVIAKNADGQVIDTKSGIFTTHDMPMGIDNVNINNSTTKSLHNGQVIIRQGNKTYNTLGQEIK